MDASITARSAARPLLAAVAALAVAACGSSTFFATTDGAVAVGTWGGDSAGMIVLDTAMHLHIACTFGDVSGRLPVDAAGNFDVRGSYMLRAFPVAVGPTLPARFTGHLEGKTAVVTVTVNDTVLHTTVVRGPVSVTLGQDPRLMPCPICDKSSDRRR